MQVTLNPYISTNRQIKQNQPQNVSFQSVYAPMAKKAMNPIHQKKGLVALGAGLVYAVKSMFDKTFTTGNDVFDRKVEYYTRNIGGSHTSLVAHYTNAEETKVMDETLSDYPQILSRIYLTQNGRGKNPLYDADLEKMQEINRVLADQPKVLEKMYLQKNRKGKIKAHKCDFAELQEMHRVFADRPDVLKKIHLTKNKRGWYPINYMEHEAQREILNLFENDEKTQSKLLDSIEGK